MIMAFKLQNFIIYLQITSQENLKVQPCSVVKVLSHNAGSVNFRMFFRSSLYVNAHLTYLAIPKQTSQETVVVSRKPWKLFYNDI